MHSAGLDRNGTSAGTYLSRKPLLKHAPRAQERPASCACGRRLQRHRHSNNSRQLPTLSAAAVADPPVKSSLRKRKQQVEPLLVVEDISKTHDGQRYLFEGVSFTVNRGDRLALVGPNGAGKSSLFKLLSGDDQPDAGVVKPKKGLTVGYLSQDPQLDESSTILDAVLQSGSSVSRAVARYEHALVIASSPDSTPQQQAALDHCMNEINALNGWNVKSDAEDILLNLGLPNPDSRVGNLSGGQKRRVALASALLAAPDMLILDEPTNHMDLGAITWMEKKLTSSNITLILVTHDRVFMEAVCTAVLELDQGVVHTHAFGGPGSYERFCMHLGGLTTFRQLFSWLLSKIREERYAAQAAVAATAKVQLRKETEWMRRQPKARSTKAKFRQDAFHELVGLSKGGPKQDVKADFGAGKMARQGTKVLVLEDAACSAGPRTVIRDFWYDFARGERIGIVGPNGAGKSSLLDMITGDRDLNQGSREVGETTALGYFRQHADEVKPDLKIVDYIREIADEGKSAVDSTGLLNEPEKLLERLGFARPRQQQLVVSLSGGERRRLQLAAVLVRKPNLLILDEPTNDLDLQTVEVVEELLASYKGCLLVVSHDRAFMEHLADRLFVVSGDGLIRMYDGPYSEYLATLDEMEHITKAVPEPSSAVSSSNSNGMLLASTEAAAPNQPPPAAKSPQKGPKMGYREKQEFERLEAQIDQLNIQKEGIEQTFLQNAANNTGYQEIAQLSESLAGLAADIETKTERWLELSDLADA